jgi:hypothetical protein
MILIFLFAFIKKKVDTKMINNLFEFVKIRASMQNMSSTHHNKLASLSLKQTKHK